jgi:hypothetical protein
MERMMMMMNHREKKVICYHADECKNEKHCFHNHPHLKYEACNHTHCNYVMGEIKGCVVLTKDKLEEDITIKEENYFTKESIEWAEGYSKLFRYGCHFLTDEEIMKLLEDMAKLVMKKQNERYEKMFKSLFEMRENITKHK